jgi:hypothetical protein
MAAKSYIVTSAIGYGVLIVFRGDTLTTLCCVRCIELCITLCSPGVLRARERTVQLVGETMQLTSTSPFRHYFAKSLFYKITATAAD